jgi:hypothetical protein
MSILPASPERVYLLFSTRPATNIMLKISKQILELEDATKEQFAAYLRANQTSAERKFWERVRYFARIRVLCRNFAV